MRRALLGSLLVLAALAAAGAPAGADTPADTPVNATTGDWLQWLNHFRDMGQVPTLTEDASLTPALVLHARYVVKEDDIAHSESSSSPWYTPEGAAIAQVSNPLGWGSVKDDRFYIEQQMSTVIHRLNLLNPKLTRSAFGAYADPSDADVVWAGVLDVITHWDFDVVPTLPATFPRTGAQLSLTTLQPEFPDVLESCPFSDPAGLPVTFMTGQVPDVTASSLTDGSGAALEHCVFDETTFESSGQFADIARGILEDYHTVALIPRDPLQPGQTYTASITSNGTPHATTFEITGDTTEPDPDEEPEPEPEPLGDTDQYRVAGADRITTATAASAARESGSATAAVVAAAGEFPDALAATPVAVALDAPLLLNGAGGLDQRVADELVRVLEPGSTVLIAGGERAVSRDVADGITALGFEVDRVAGPDRFATAVALAGKVAEPELVFIASGQTFPDALSAGAAAGANSGVVVLSDGDQLPDVTIDYLNDHLDTLWVTVGGAASTAVPEAEVPLVGADRYETATLVAEQLFDGSLAEMAIASGANFPDGLAAGAALRGAGPLVLVAPDHVPQAVTDYLELNRGTPMRVFGGSGAIADTVVAALARTLDLPL